ncbi:MAG: alpha/beta fold hydrolase [Muribaculaceae bacterium]|nr:alpha/beta fold hydrolase [Muribaculaceae bacterium]
MKKMLSAVAAVALAALHGGAVTGSWRGNLDLNVAKLPLVFNFGDQGGCTLDSPAQGAKGIPVEVVFSSADSIALDLPAIGATFRGRVTPDSIRGFFSQGGMLLPLLLEPETPVDERRPQTPRGPFPYETVDTVFCSADGTELAATLTLPSRPVAVAVMVTGSGPQNRDEELFEHKPFAVIADRLARAGVATLRYDDRGTGASKGDFAAADIDTFRADASAALACARTAFPQLPAGVIGHSEGGTIALMLAADGECDFVVSMAGMAVSGKETVMAQNRRSLRAGGFTDTQVADAVKILDFVFTGIMETGSAPDVDSFMAANGIELPRRLVDALKQGLESAPLTYFRKMLSLEPAGFIGRIACPVLALNGTLDTQVDAVDNLALIARKIPSAKTRVYPGLNHLFQPATTGSVDEYGDIRVTISEDVLADIAAFCKNF